MGWGSYVRLLLRDHATAGKGVIDCVTVELRVGAGGSYVRLLLRDRATAPWGWGWGWGGAVTFASYCVTVPLRPGGGAVTFAPYCVTMRLHPGAGEGGN